MKLDELFLPYQREWIADTAGVKVYEKSRRIGITYAEAFDAALTAATAGRRGEDCWYIGYNREMALEFVETTAMWARRLNKAANTVEETTIDDEDKDILAYRIRFASGYKIVALSSRPSNLRGKQGRAIIDEAAFHDALDELLKAALAFRIWGGHVHIISTHDGDANPFNQLVNDIRAGRLPYSLHRTTFDDALAQGLYRAICRENDREYTRDGEQNFRREVFAEYGDKADEELLCIPSAGGGAFLTTALIESRMDPAIPVLRFELPYTFLEKTEYERVKDAEDWCREFIDPEIRKINSNLMSCFGEDFGRSGDLTVIWPLQFMPNLVRRTPFVVEMRNIPFRQQEQVLFYIVDRLPRFIAGALDARGNGQSLAEQAALRYGGGDNGRIQQVMLSIDWYRDNMPRYKAAFEDGTIAIPRDAEILNDHRALRMEKGVARVPDRHTQSDGGKQRHGDSAIAGALAYFASTLNPMEYGYRPAPKVDGFGRLDRDSFPARPDHSGDRDAFSARKSRFRNWLGL